MTSFAFFSSELAFNQHLRGDTCMVGTHLPEGVFLLHSLPTGEGIHNRVLESMTHVQAAGDVRRWNHNTKGFALTGGTKVTELFPFFSPTLFYFGGLIGFIKRGFWLSGHEDSVDCW